MSRARWRFFSAAIATIALAVTALVAGPAMAAVPGPPTIVTARAGDQLAEVTWTAPTPDDPTITGYEVSASPADTPPVTVDPTARTATVPGLINGTADSFTVAATNPDGPSPASAPSAPVIPGPPAVTTLTLAASPTSVLYGGTVQLSGRLQLADTAEGIAGETLTLERRPKGGTSWTALATVTTGGDGTLDPTQAVTPQAYTEYRLRHPATPFYAASTSRTITVRVGVRLAARLNRTHMALGRTATISGQVIPAHRGQRIRLQYKQGRTWRTTQAKALPATGRYYFNLRPQTTGTSWWRVYKASDTDHIGAISRTFRLVVYRAAITGIHADAAGDDRRNRNGEYALVRNTGAAAINLTSWKLDAGDRSQRFTLPGYALKKGATVRIHTGRGTTKPGHLYLGSGRPIWNNDGDTATLIDPDGVTVSRFRY
ncbi:MAG TPA: lamin tail domain-containing protein [Actinomycetes bacterium]|nr:lamin tail domain-containing protein [Actinomycetes bacterium]